MSRANLSFDSLKNALGLKNEKHGHADSHWSCINRTPGRIPTIIDANWTAMLFTSIDLPPFTWVDYSPLEKGKRDLALETIK